MSKYYITTTAPYVNAEPHIGYALEAVQADVLARYHRSLGDEVLFGIGTDEHGKKIYEKALEQNIDPQVYTDEYAAKFDKLKEALNLSYDLFTRTTDKHHIEAAQEMWRRCLQNGFINKGTYRAKYCVGCELEKTDSELVEGKCPLHPNKEIEHIEEENYFFKFSDPRIQQGLIKYYDENPEFVVPSHRQKEIRNFVEKGLTDFSISRIAKKMPWGVPVPDDPEQVMYVWFDALTFYISALGFPDDMRRVEEYWGGKDSPRGVQVAGKDNLRQQTAMWQAMLLASDMAFSRQVLIHGFVTSEGQKMSKSLGNVVNPLDYVQEFGVDPLRYYLLAKISPFEDSDFTREKFVSSYGADLQNGLGNLVSRIATMASGMSLASVSQPISGEVGELIGQYRFDEAMKHIWGRIDRLNTEINAKEVWKLEGEQKVEVLSKLILELRQVAVDLSPFLPETSRKIWGVFEGEIKKITPIFPRLG